MSSKFFDVVVVGAGPCGLIWSRAAIQAGKRVLLIDSGNYVEASYSAFNVPWISQNEVVMGGVGGAANAWQGQSLSLNEKQFSFIFNTDETWDYQKYFSTQKYIENLLKIRVNHNSDAMRKEVKADFDLQDGDNIQFSYIPSELRWKKIFADTLKSKALIFEQKELVRLELETDTISKLFFQDGTFMEIEVATQVVLAINARNTAKVLQESDKNSEELFPNVRLFVADHPWRINLRFDSNRNRQLRRKTFTSHRSLRFRMKSKIKFEVVSDGIPIGAFELRPNFSGGIGYKIINRISQGILGLSVLTPKYVDVFAQIAQASLSNPVIYDHPDNDLPIDILSKEDLQRFEKVEMAATELLGRIGLKVIGSNQLDSFGQAFHPSGNIDLGNNPKEFSFNNLLQSNKFHNLYIAGACSLRNALWLNPTFTILVHSLYSANVAFSQEKGSDQLMGKNIRKPAN